MLLALADRALATPELRADLESTSGEGEERRRHAGQMKSEMAAWETRRKKLDEARLRCKSAAETKANKQAYSTEHREHDLRVAFLNVGRIRLWHQTIALTTQVNLRAQQARRAPRHEPLGVDLDGRVYYALAPRIVDEDGRPPIGWASGLLVWGAGVPSKPGADSEDELPSHAERWSHFGKSPLVRQLIKWLDWRLKKTLASMKAPKVSNPARSPLATPNKAAANSSKITNYLKPSDGTLFRQLNNVLLPGRDEASKRSSSEEDGESSASSDLTPPPVALADEIRQTLAPAGYTPSRHTIEEAGRELIRRLKEVAEWLEVLEWKGMGEVH